MKSYSRICSAIASTPWAIEPKRLQLILSILEARSEGVSLPIEAAQPREQMSPTGVAVIPVFGTISHRMQLMDAESGGASALKITQQVEDAVANPAIGSVVLNIDSPGGTVDGVPEAFEAIRALRGGDTPIVAVANTMAASAAYWLASAADEIVVSPSAQVGSIGVFAVHEDFSEWYKAQGVEPTLIASTPYKAETVDFRPLSEDARQHLEDEVLAYDDMFVNAVALGRGVTEKLVRQDFGQGRMVMADAAVRAGMADRVGTLKSVVSERLSVQSDSRRRRFAMMRHRLNGFSGQSMQAARRRSVD